MVSRTGDESMEITVREEGIKQISQLNYFQIMNRLMVSPGHFFQEDLISIDSARALRFLIVSSLFLTLAKACLLQQAFLRMSLITFVNAVVMPFLSVVIGYFFIKRLLGKKILFKRLFIVYALSSGLTMLIAWIPLFLWIAEPWKWYLIGLGLIRGCGLGLRQTLVVIILSLFLIVSFFWAVNEVILLFL